MRPGALAERILDDGREVVMYGTIFNARLCIGWPDGPTYDDFYCFADWDAGRRAMNAWSGQGDPPGPWTRHGASGRRRPDGDPSKEYISR